MEAEISGPQRKVVSASVRPARSALGDDGIVTRNGRTLPFVLTRRWSAPAGHYAETWYLIDPKTREVLFEGPVNVTLIWGLQALTEVIDEVTEPIRIAPGSYQIVFALGGLMGGTLDVEVTEAPAKEAA